jgi:hypothetical protein
MGVAIRDTPKDSKPRGKSDRGNLKEIPFIFIAPCWQGTSRPDADQMAVIPIGAEKEARL